MLRQKNGLPFGTCDFCGKKLEFESAYVIAKAFEKGRLGMEAVQCFSCQENASGYVSNQSAENLQLYAGRRFAKFMERDAQEGDSSALVRKCLFTGEDLSMNDSFELYTLHLPMTHDNPCFLVGPTAVEQMGELLSEETRKFWDNYIQQIEPISPEWVISPLFLR